MASGIHMQFTMLIRDGQQWQCWVAASTQLTGLFEMPIPSASIGVICEVSLPGIQAGKFVGIDPRDARHQHFGGEGCGDGLTGMR